MKRYSQNLEQDHILKYFEGRKGTFIDIGANSGIDLSNTRALAELGWSGCFIEPSPKAFAYLKENYKGLSGFYFYNVALGDHNGNAILQESSSLLNAADIGLVSTFEASEMQRFKSICTYEPVTVKMYKWKTFYNRLRIKEFNFVNLDIEGYELKVLPDMNLSKTEMVCIEWNSKPELKEQYDHYLKDFKVIYTSGENLLYAR